MAIAEGELKVGDRVVYPNQGVCRVVGTTEMEIAGQRQIFIKLAREEDDASVMVPQGRVNKVGLRHVADLEELKKVLAYLAAPVEGPELDWKVRHRAHGERMSEGGLMDLAHVVKGLATLADLRALPPKERELYDNARHLFVSEIAASTGLPDSSAEDAVDLALFPPGVKREKLSLDLLLSPGGDDSDLGFDEGFDDPLGAGTAESDDLADSENEQDSDDSGDKEDDGDGALEEAGTKSRAKKGAEKEPKKKAAPKAAAKPKQPKAPRASAKKAKSASPEASSEAQADSDEVSKPSETLDASGTSPPEEPKAKTRKNSRASAAGGDEKATSPRAKTTKPRGKKSQDGGKP